MNVSIPGLCCNSGQIYNHVFLSDYAHCAVGSNYYITDVFPNQHYAIIAPSVI